MNDTAPEVARLVRQKLMERSGEERFLMGVRMFDAAREMVLASLPSGLPPADLKRQLFRRLYGVSAPFCDRPRHSPDLPIDASSQ